MASIISLTLRQQLRLVSPFIERMGITSTRQAQDKVGELGARANMEKLVLSPAPFDLFKAEFLTPRAMATDEDGVILYLHGGGYVAGGIDYARGFASMLCVHSRLPVLSVAYRLAPEDPYPAALDDAVSAYRYLLDSGYAHDRIRLVGESAGGGLCFCLCHALKEKGIPLPQSVVALSPWTDLTFSGQSYIDNKTKDPSISEDMLREYAVLYALDQCALDKVSPIFGDCSGFPRTLFFVGGDEVLLSDTLMMHEKLLSSGCESTLHVEDGLWHVYVLYGIPEAKAAMREIAVFLNPRAESDDE